MLPRSDAVLLNSRVTELAHETEKFFGTMAWQAFADDFAGRHVERQTTS
jgi:hypothetical protein